MTEGTFDRLFIGTLAVIFIVAVVYVFVTLWFKFI